jgi:DNA repair protein RadC
VLFTEDIEVTARLKEAGKVLGINLLDHIIFNHKDCYSFLENDQL